MIVVPYVAVPLYLMIGGRKYRKLIREKGGVVFGDSEEEFSGDLHPIDTLLRNFGIPGACAGNSLDVFQTGEETFAALMEQIEEAQESIFIETFVFTLDSTGQAIFDALVRRAREGVTVCLLVDGLGSMHFKQRDFKPLLDAGGHGAIFLPVMRLPFQGKTNTRDHRKMAIFDRVRVIAGGSNLAEEYMGPTPLPDRWKDINFLLEGPRCGTTWRSSAVTGHSQPEPRRLRRSIRCNTGSTRQSRNFRWCPPARTFPATRSTTAC